MAEAKLAVAFSFNVSHEGVTLDYDKELVKELMHTAKRSWRYRFIRFWVCTTPHWITAAFKLTLIRSALQH